MKTTTLKADNPTTGVTEVPMFSGAETVVKCLLAEGVDTLFGYPGGAIMPVYDALYDYQDELKHVLARHEQGAIHAAQGFARATGKVGVCMATSGPGATNLITGIADAQIDSTPLVCITGQVHKDLLGTDAFQETDVVGISMPVTKWNYQVTSAKEIPEAIAKAFYIARSGRPGPVLVDITKNAQFELEAFHYESCRKLRSYFPCPKVDQEALTLAAKLLNEAKKPFLLFGQGVLLAEAEKELESFLNKTGIPAAWTILGQSALPSEHPLNVGMLGMHGNYAPNKLTNECDVLIAVGMRFDDRVTGDLTKYARQAKVIHVEIDPSEINKNVPADIALLGDAKTVLQELMPQVESKVHPAWLKEFHNYAAEEYDKVISKDLFEAKGALTMAEVIHQLNQLTNEEALLVTDVGQHQMITSRFARLKNSRSMITSGGLGTMGFCLPAAIGAKMGCPDRQVIGVVGDGGVQMTIQEFGTIMEQQLDVKLIILNNGFLGMVRQWQELFFDKRYASTQMQNPNFQLIASGYGIASEKVTERNELPAALERMLNHKGSFVLEVGVANENNVFPMIPTGASVSDVVLSSEELTAKR